MRYSRSESAFLLIQLVYQVASSHALQFADDVAAFFGFVPEEEHALSQFLFLCLGREDRFQCVGVESRVPGFCGYGHRGRGEVLNLFQVEVQVLGDDRQFGHVFFRTSRMAADEVGDKLLAEIQFLIQLVEDALEAVELLERRFPHQVQYPVTGMFGSYFQPSAHVAGNQFARVGCRTLVYRRVFAFV